MLALHLLQSALVHVNTLLMQEVLADPKWADKLTDADRRALSPLFWTHVNPRPLRLPPPAGIRPATIARRRRRSIRMTVGPPALGPGPPSTPRQWVMPQGALRVVRQGAQARDRRPVRLLGWAEVGAGARNRPAAAGDGADSGRRGLRRAGCDHGCGSRTVCRRARAHSGRDLGPPSPGWRWPLTRRNDHPRSGMAQVGRGVKSSENQQGQDPGRRRSRSGRSANSIARIGW